MNRSTVAAAALAVLAPAALSLSGSAANAAPTSADARSAAAPYKVVAKINKAEVVAGEDTVRITGSVKPKAAGQTVILQQRFDGTKRWKKSGTAKIKATGKFVLKDDPSTPGVRFYRVLKPAGNGFAAGKSAELKLAVWAWDKLTFRTAGANAGIKFNQYPQFGTETYPNSLTTNVGSTGFVEYTLGRKCRTLRATYALTDDSATGATGTVAVVVDGATKVTHGLTTGVIQEQHTLDVTNAFRIRFDAAASATPAGITAIGTPEVLCLD